MIGEGGGELVRSTVCGDCGNKRVGCGVAARLGASCLCTMTGWCWRPTICLQEAGGNSARL